MQKKLLKKRPDIKLNRILDQTTRPCVGLDGDAWLPVPVPGRLLGRESPPPVPKLKGHYSINW